MSRTLDDSLRWTDHGTKVFLDTLISVSDQVLAGPTALPGWTGKHLVAHVAANADALGNLVRWAATGEEHPMYASSTQRNDDIKTGATRSAAALRTWAERSAHTLSEAWRRLTSVQWSAQVRTAQGRTVPATEIPWLRAREVLVHAVDLGAGVTFADLPEDFLLALVDDVVARRSSVPGPALDVVAEPGSSRWSVAPLGAQTPAGEVRGSLDGLAAYLTGRDATGVRGADSAAVPDLPPWL